VILSDLAHHPTRTEESDPLKGEIIYASPPKTHGPLTNSAAHISPSSTFPSLLPLLMSHPHTDLENRRPYPSCSQFQTHNQNGSCTCHHLHIHHHPNHQRHLTGNMSEEILFDRSMIEGRFGRRRDLKEPRFNRDHYRFGNDRYETDGRGGSRLNPKAQSFLV